MTIKLRPYDKTTPPMWEGHLRLEQRGDGVMVRAVYPTGEPVHDGNLLMVSSYGLWRLTGITSSLGLPLDDLGRIALDNAPGESARIAELEAEVARLTGSEATPDKGAWVATEEDQKRTGCCLVWMNGRWTDLSWKATSLGSWVREQPPPPPGGGA